MFNERLETIYQAGEHRREATIRKFRIVQNEGGGKCLWQSTAKQLIDYKNGGSATEKRVTADKGGFCADAQ